MDKSGNIWSWGSGKNGEFASGFADNRDSPKEIVNNYPFWTKIWSGGPGNEIYPNIGYNLAINVHGELYFWGALFDDPTVSGNFLRVSYSYASGMSFVPAKIGVKNDWITCSIGRARAINASDARYTHAMAIDSVGDLYAWGYNSYGQLGNGNINLEINPVKIGENYTEISCGVNCSLGLKQNGDVYFWGRKNNNKILSPQLIYADTGYTKISKGYSCSIGLKSNGEVYAWDLLGTSGPILISSNCKFIDAGVKSAIAIKENGDLYEWKYLGVNSKNITFEREPKLLGTNYSSAVVSLNHSLAMKENGDLYGWGLSKNGVLGYIDPNPNAPPIVDPIKIDEGYFNIAAGPGHSIGLKESFPVPTPTPVCDLSLLAQSPIVLAPSSFGKNVPLGETGAVSWPPVSFPGYGIVSSSFIGVASIYSGDPIYLCDSSDYYIPNNSGQIQTVFANLGNPPTKVGMDIFFEKPVNDVVVLLSGMVLGEQYEVSLGDWRSFDAGPYVDSCGDACPEHPGPLDDPDYIRLPIEESDNDVNLIIVKYCNTFVHENRITGSGLNSGGDVVVRINSSKNYRRIRFYHTCCTNNNNESQPAIDINIFSTYTKIAILPSCEITNPEPTPEPTPDCPVCEKINCELDTSCLTKPVSWTIGEAVLNRKCDDGVDRNAYPNGCRGGGGTWHVIDRWVSWNGNAKTFKESYTNPCCPTELITSDFTGLYAPGDNFGIPQPIGSIVDGVIVDLPSGIQHPPYTYSTTWFLLVNCQ